MGKRILILNHTRIGDLIQTTPLIAGLKREEPDCHITLLANSKFARIVDFSRGIDAREILDLEQFNVTNDAGGVPLLPIYDYLDDLVTRLNARKFDIVINLNSSKLSAILTLLLDAPEKRGFLANERGESLLRNPWLIYFNAFLAFRRYNRFNLVDMFMRAGGVDPWPGDRLILNPDDKATESIATRLTQYGVKEGETLIALQAGASREDRRWPPEYFATVADHFSRERKAKIILLGAPSEKILGDQVESAMTSEAINLIGETSLAELVALTERLNLLITNDTGTMHVAASQGAPIVALFFVHARVEETGPYAGGALILSAGIACHPCTHQTTCDHYSCLRDITPNDVIEAGSALLDQRLIRSDDPALFRNSHLHQSSDPDERGIDYVPVTKEPLTKYELFAYLYRPLFITFLAEWESPGHIILPAEEIETALRHITERFALPEGKGLAGWIDWGRQGAKELVTLASEGMTLADKIDGASDAQGMNQTAQRLSEIDFTIDAIGASHDALSPLTLTYRRRVENFEGDEPRTLARQAQEAHHWIKNASNSLLSAMDRAEKSLTPPLLTNAPQEESA